MTLENYPFYERARKLWEKTQEQQIVKGLHKYEEPFTPAHWTSEQLLDHALQESVDLVHYLVGMQEKNIEMHREIHLLRAELAIARHRVEVLEREKASYFIPETKKPTYYDLDDEF